MRMKLLAIDTSGPVCGAAVMQDSQIICDCAVNNKLTHSANLMPMVDYVLSASGMTIRDIDRIAVVTGPGSFTGVRIGVSTVKGLTHGADVPCVAIDALEAMAASIPAFEGVICPIQDARAGQVYGAAFKAGMPPERLMDDIPMKLEDFVREIQAFGNRFLFLGDGMPVHRTRLTELLGDAAVFAPPQNAYLRPAAVAALAMNSDAQLSYTELMPMYLRAPSAERNKKLMEAAKHDK